MRSVPQALSPAPAGARYGLRPKWLRHWSPLRGRKPVSALGSVPSVLRPLSYGSRSIDVARSCIVIANGDAIKDRIPLATCRMQGDPSGAAAALHPAVFAEVWPMTSPCIGNAGQ